MSLKKIADSEPENHLCSSNPGATSEISLFQIADRSQNPLFFSAVQQVSLCPFVIMIFVPVGGGGSLESALASFTFLRFMWLADISKH